MCFVLLMLYGSLQMLVPVNDNTLLRTEPKMQARVMQESLLMVQSVCNQTLPCNKTLLCNQTLPQLPTHTVSPAAAPLPTIHFISFGNGRFARSVKRITQEARDSGWFATAQGFNQHDLPSRFLLKYPEIMNQSRIGGYGTWRMVLIEHVMNMLVAENDFVLYLDAGFVVNSYSTEARQNFMTLVRELNESSFGVTATRIGLPEYEWTTDRIFKFFNISRDNSMRNSSQFGSGALLMQKNAAFFKMAACVNSALEEDEWMFSDRYNEESKKLNPLFQENRHEQSVFSVCNKIHGALVIPYGRVWGYCGGYRPMAATIEDCQSRYPTLPFWISHHGDRNMNGLKGSKRR